jgi:hypothetical protein
MPQMPIHPEFVKVALSRASGGDFENFANDFLPAIIGSAFVPSGGTKDGGADGLEEPIHENEAKRVFYQASIERSPEAKIRRTVKRLREFGRDPRTLVYITSQTVKYIDRLEDELTNTLDVNIRIRDGIYIQAHINDSVGTRHAYDVNLRHLTDYLSHVGASKLIPTSKHVKSPAVYVFLSQEVARRSGDVSLVNAVTDSLALWALEGTDHAKDIYRTSAEVHDLICQELPAMKRILQDGIQGRLEQLWKRKPDGSRDVRWNKRENKFCLPHEVVQRIEAENVADESLRLAVLADFEERVRGVPNSGVTNEDEVELAAEVMLRSLQYVYESEGLEFARYLEDSEARDFPTVVDAAKKAIAEIGLQGKKSVRVASAVMPAVRGVLYSSTENERRYLAKLSRTYALLFTLNAEPRLIEFFQDLAGDLRLYVGSDILVRALSESFLAGPDRMTRTALEMVSSLGASLILTEPVLEEVVHHFRGSDLEYRNHYQKIDAHVDFYMARNIPKIMLRTYFYARLADSTEVARPKSWEAFVHSFCDYNELHRTTAFQDMRRYLQAEYHLEFESANTLRERVNGDDLPRLTKKLLEIKSGKYELAQNDALMALNVYGRRASGKEDVDSTSNSDTKLGG